MTDPADLTVTIVDGYVDEPAHFGVPPYISTYPRYTAGALVDAGVSRGNIRYHTIDALRAESARWSDVESADLVVYLGGMTVPGKYVGGRPAEPDEIRRVAWTAGGTSLMGGPVRFGVGEENRGAMETERADLDFEFVAKGDVEAAAYDLVHGGLEGFGDRMRSVEEVTRWAQLGAFVVEQHPNHPEYLICELETGRGCPYRCSFCTEPLYGNPSFRPPETVVAEVEALAACGVRDFRLGRQADILAYGGDGEAPNPKALSTLYTGIHEVVPDLRTLHLDNLNPITIVKWPERARDGLAIIARYNTPGDTAAFGLESADPVVQERNDLNVTAEECFEAVRVVNEVAGWRPEEGPPASAVATDGGGSGTDATGAGHVVSRTDADLNRCDARENAVSNGEPEPPQLPKLLPGINLLHGLKGEREETYAHNLEFLERVYEAGLMVRRVNVRQVMTFPGTDMAETGADIALEHHRQFKQYKRRVRETFDRPMLERVAPPGTVLRDVHLEYVEDGLTFGRQLGTYPLLVALPGERSPGTTLDVAIVDHGYRSVTGIPYPLDLNRASMSELTAIPGIGRRRAASVVSGRPYERLSAVPVDPSVALSTFATVERPD